MTKKSEPLAQFRPRPQSVAKLRSREAMLPTEEWTFEARKLAEIAELLWLPESLPEAERNARILRALEFYEELAPQSAAEGMLAAQMVGTHAAALDCLRRAAYPGQSACSYPQVRGQVIHPPGLGLARGQAIMIPHVAPNN